MELIIEELHFKIDRLWSIIEMQRYEMARLANRIDALEMADPPVIRTLYEDLMNKSESLDSTLDASTVSTTYPPTSLDYTVRHLFDLPQSSNNVMSSARNVPRYSHSDVLEIGRRWTNFAGVPPRMTETRHISIIPTVSSSTLPLLAACTNRDGSETGSLRITIDNRKSIDMISSIPSEAAPVASNSPRKSFRQVLELYGSNDDQEKKIGPDRGTVSSEVGHTHPCKQGKAVGKRNGHRHVVAISKSKSSKPIPPKYAKDPERQKTMSRDSSTSTSTEIGRYGMLIHTPNEK